VNVKLKSMVNIILKELIIKKLPVNQEYRFCIKAYFKNEQEAPCFDNETC